MFPTLQAKLIAAALLLLVLAGAFGTYTYHERHVGAEAKVEQLKMSSAKLIQKADEHIAALNSTHAAAVAAILETAHAQHETDLLQHTSDADRLREYDAYRRSHPAVASASSGPGNQSAGSVSVVTDDDRLTSLEQVALGLATAGRDSQSALKSCTVERDSLTGK